MKFTSKICVKIIQIIHLLIILYIIIGPFYKNQIDQVIGLLIFIILRWITNNHECNLTKIENFVTGKKEGFISRIVNPVYKLNESSMNKIIYFTSFSWLIILILIKLEG